MIPVVYEDEKVYQRRTESYRHGRSFITGKDEGVGVKTTRREVSNTPCFSHYIQVILNHFKDSESLSKTLLGAIIVNVPEDCREKYNIQKKEGLRVYSSV